MINIIAAVAENGVIGDKGKLPWTLKNDMARFKALTMGHAVIFGHNTFNEIAKPLVGRLNIMLSSRTQIIEGVEVCSSLNEALELASATSQEIFICGGEDVYRQSMTFADRLYITHVSKKFDGDRFFPMIPDDFILTSSESLADSGIDTTFCVYQRNPQR